MNTSYQSQCGPWMVQYLLLGWNDFLLTSQSHLLCSASMHMCLLHQSYSKDHSKLKHILKSDQYHYNLISWISAVLCLFDITVIKIMKEMDDKSL